MNSSILAKALSPKDLEQLMHNLDQAVASNKIPESSAVAIRLLAATGMRQAELFALCPSDLKDEEQAILIDGAKNSNGRLMKLKSDLYKATKAIAKESRHGYIFNLPQRTLSLHWHLVRPTQHSPHSLRHTFAINLLQKTKDIALVQYALGHKSIRNTMIYLEIDHSEALARALESE